MFNRKEKEQLNKLTDEVVELKSLLEDSGIKYVDNYFKGCPCCKGEPGRLLLSKAKSFKRKEMVYGFMCSFKQLITYYTTENSYKLHEKKIKEWEAEKI